MTRTNHFSIGNSLTCNGYKLFNPIRFRMGWLHAHTPDGWFSLTMKFLSKYAFPLYSVIIQNISQGGTLEHDDLTSLQILQAHWPSGTNPHMFKDALDEIDSGVVGEIDFGPEINT